MTTKGVICSATTDDYVEMAMYLAATLKWKSPGVQFALIVDETLSIPPKTAAWFDYVIPVKPSINGFISRNRAFELSPFDQTLLTDADMVFPEDILWWFPILEKSHISWGKAIDFRGNLITSRDCREAFDAVMLPDVYSALFYFDKSEESRQFFSIVENVQSNWTTVRRSLFPAPFKFNLRPDTDVVFAIAALLCNIVPQWQPQFVHLKPDLQGGDKDLNLEPQWLYLPPTLMINQSSIEWPLHYVYKMWLDKQTKSIIRGRATNALRNS